MGDPYADPSTGVLRNRLGITDSDELRAAEADISAAALFRLETSSHLGEGHFDFSHLRALHVHIFGEIYSWAGKPRTVDMAKGAWFCLARNIEDFAASVFRELAADNYLVGLDRPDLVKGIAATYGQLNALHPFREGNGRTQRAFLTQLGRLGGWRLRWSDLDRDTNDEASRRSLEDGDDSALAEMINTLLEEEPSSVPVETARRVVLAIPAVAAEVPGGLEPARRGPYPSQARCSTCGEQYAVDDEPSVVLLRPLPPPDHGILTFAHARCGRSRILRQPSAREVREWHAAREREGDDATGRAIVIGKPSVRAGFVWRPDFHFLGSAGGDVIDPLFNKGLALGLQLAPIPAPPDERTPGWSVTVDTRSRSVNVTDPEGGVAFMGAEMDLPPTWIEAVVTSGECVIYQVSRGELDSAGLAVAAQEGRVLVGLAAATVSP